MTSAAPPRLAEGVRVYTVGDIHGRADLLAETFDLIDADRLAATSDRVVEVYLGDFIDRGPASKQVLDLLIGRAEHREIVCLKGNHEDLALQFLSAPEVYSDWSRLGGRETLMSYGLSPLARNPEGVTALARAFDAVLPSAHRSFLARLEVFYVCGDFFFVHAGVRPGVALDRQREADLLWIRQEFLSWEAPFEKMIVHGHTPVSAADFRDNRINIDTGAFATGRLTCLRIKDSDIRVL